MLSNIWTWITDVYQINEVLPASSCKPLAAFDDEKRLAVRFHIAYRMKSYGYPIYARF